MFELLNNRRNGDDSYSVRPIEDNRPKNGKLQGLYRGIGKVLASVFLAAFFICSLENVNVFAEAREELDAYKIIWGDNSSDEKTYFVPLSITNSLTINSRVKVQGNITLELTAGTALVIPQGIEVPQGSTLTITGTGKLDIPRASNGNAGIGSNNNADGGIIKILNGQIMVDATRSEAAAAIGSSKEHKLEEINIAGGTIIAKGGFGGVGIGSGINAGFSKIIISGGYIDAGGGQNGCGIGGCGTSDNDDSVIMISGENTQVMAQGWGAPGIGIREGHLNLLSISGGEVHAITTGPEDNQRGSAAIGCGGYSNRNLKIDKIEISGGKVEANVEGGIRGAGIGLGFNHPDRSHKIQEINITGGEIHARGRDSAGIGCRSWDSGEIGKINISGGDIFAECKVRDYYGDKDPGIGGRVYEINISGGKIKATTVDDDVAEIAAFSIGNSAPQINISGGYVKADKIEAKNDGKISTTGNAIIDSGNMTGFDEKNPKCIWLKGENYKDSGVYGDVSTTTDAELPAVNSNQAKLSVPNGASLKIGSGTTFTVNQKFTLENKSTITVEGTLIIKRGAKIDNRNGKIILNGGNIQIEDGAEVVKADKYTGNIPKPTAKRTESGLIELNVIAVPSGA